MNTFSIIGLVIGVISVFISLLVVIKGRRQLHFIWSLFIFSVSVWGFGSFMVAKTMDIGSAILWWRLSYIGVIFIPILFTHFTYEFLSLKKRWPLLIYYFIGIFFLITNLFSNLFINEVRLVFDSFYYISPPGVLYTPFLVLFFGLVTFCIIEFLKANRNTFGIKKNQIRYFLLAAIIGFFGGSFSFLPVYSIDFYPFLNGSIVVAILIITYAIFKYRFLDIRLVISKSILYFFLVLFVALSFTFVTFTTAQFLEGRGQVVVTLVVSLVIVIFLDPLKRLLAKWTDKFFYKGKIDYQDVLRQIGQGLARELDLSRLANNIVELLKEKIKIKKANILIAQDNGNRFTTLEGSANISLAKEDIIIRYYELHNELVITEELARRKSDSKNSADIALFEELEKRLDELNIALVVPIFVPLFYLLFAYHYPYRLWNYPPFLIRAIIAITLILEICFLSGFLNFQEFFITNGVIHQKTFFVDFLIFSIYFFSYVLWGLLILFKKLKRVEGVYRINLKYLIAATLSTFVIIGVISIIMPLLGNYTYDWLGPIFTLVHFIFVGYLLFFRDLKIVRS